MALKIGFIGIVGEQLREDPEGTLRWVADLGLNGIEGAAGLAEHLGLSLARTRKKLESLGLQAAAQGGIKPEQDEKTVAQAIADARAIGARYVINYFAPCKSKEEILGYADHFNKVGRMCREEGLRFCYHNHAHEFRRFDGQYGLDILLDSTDPELVFSELDVAWVTYGGADPVAMVEKYLGRCPVLHMKDIVQLEEGCEAGLGPGRAAKFTEVGTGIVNTGGVVEAARRAGVEWLVIEQDRMRDLPPRESLEVSFRNLKALVG